MGYHKPPRVATTEVLMSLAKQHPHLHTDQFLAILRLQGYEVTENDKPMRELKAGVCSDCHHPSAQVMMSCSSCRRPVCQPHTYICFECERPFCAEHVIQQADEAFICQQCLQSIGESFLA